MGFCCKGVSETPSVLFHFLAVKQTKSHNVIFIPAPKIKQLVLCKIMANCKVVIFFSGFDMDWGKLLKPLLCGKFLWLHGINPLLFSLKSHLLESCDYYESQVPSPPSPHPEFSYSLQILKKWIFRLKTWKTN